MRAHTEVVFDGYEEQEILRNASRWIGAEGSPDYSVERGGRLLMQNNQSYTRRQLTDILDWIVASCEHYDDQVEKGERIMEANFEPVPGGGLALIANPALAGQIMVETANEAHSDLIAASYLITEALKIATPKREYA